MPRERMHTNDVTPHDGLQIERGFISAARQVALVDALGHARLP